MRQKKAKKILSILLTSALTLTAIGSTKPTEARTQSKEFFCSLKQGQLVTVANVDRGTVKLINWQQYASENYNLNSLQTLCVSVSARMQKYADLGKLNYISLAQLNERLFLCASNSQGTCLQDNSGYLLPLQTHQNSKQFLLGLFNAPSEAVIEKQKLVIDFQKLLATRLKAYNSKLTKYRCIDREGTPVTVIDTPRGSIDLIVWSQNLLPQYLPRNRCEIITSRFQKHASTNNLRFISWGTVNNSRAICVSDANGKCQPDGLLITLNQQDNPELVLRQLFDLNTPLTRAKTVIDLNRKL